MRSKLRQKDIEVSAEAVAVGMYHIHFGCACALPNNLMPAMLDTEMNRYGVEFSCHKTVDKLLGNR